MQGVNGRDARRNEPRHELGEPGLRPFRRDAASRPRRAGGARCVERRRSRSRRPAPSARDLREARSAPRAVPAALAPSVLGARFHRAALVEWPSRRDGAAQAYAWGTAPRRRRRRGGRAGARRRERGRHRPRRQHVLGARGTARRPARDRFVARRREAQCAGARARACRAADSAEFGPLRRARDRFSELRRVSRGARRRFARCAAADGLDLASGRGERGVSADPRARRPQRPREDRRAARGHDRIARLRHRRGVARTGRSGRLRRRAAGRRRRARADAPGGALRSGRAHRLAPCRARRRARAERRRDASPGAASRSRPARAVFRTGLRPL